MDGPQHPRSRTGEWVPGPARRKLIAVLTDRRAILTFVREELDRLADHTLINKTATVPLLRAD
jgi:hypothetical protein